MTIDSEGNLITVGIFKKSIHFDSGDSIYSLEAYSSNNNYFILKQDSIGNVLWFSTGQGACEYNAHDVKCDSDDNIYLAGDYTGVGDFNFSDTVSTESSSYGGDDGFLLKLNKDGEFVWVKFFQGIFYKNRDERCKSLFIKDSAIYIWLENLKARLMLTRQIQLSL